MRGERRRIPSAPQRQAQVLPLLNSGKVHAEAPKEDVLINGNSRLNSFLEGHAHPHVAVRHHFKSPNPVIEIPPGIAGSRPGRCS